MYYERKEVPLVGTRRLITISLPPRLLREAERIAGQENRTKSELLREALRFYIETSEVRRKAARERLFGLRVATGQVVPVRHQGGPLFSVDDKCCADAKGLTLGAHLDEQ